MWLHDNVLTNIFNNLFEFLLLKTICIGRILKHGKETSTRTQLHYNDFILGPQLWKSFHSEKYKQ